MAFERWACVSSIGDLLIGSAAKNPDRPALVMPDISLTYADILKASVEVARGIAALGIRPRAHVGILANNGEEFVSAFFGALLANCVAVPLNARHKERELGYIIENADLEILLTTARDTTFVDFRKNLRSALPGISAHDATEALTLETAPNLKHVVLLEGEATPGFMDKQHFLSKAQSVSPDEINQRRQCTKLRDIGIIIYTSGTTANPKGCMLTHEAVSRGPVERADTRFRTNDHDVTWAGGPLFHIGSLAPFLGSVGTAGTYVTDVAFDPKRAFDMMEHEKVTAAWPWFPAILQPMLDHPEFHTDRLSHLRKVLFIGPQALLLRAQSLFPQAEFIQACGMTETAGIFALCGADETMEQRATSNGKRLRA